MLLGTEAFCKLDLRKKKPQEVAEAFSATLHIRLKKRLLNEADFRIESGQFGRVDQSGMIATLASWRSRVQIPPRPPFDHFGLTLVVALWQVLRRFRRFLMD